MQKVEQSTSDQKIAGLSPTLPAHMFTALLKRPWAKTMNPTMLLVVIKPYG